MEVANLSQSSGKSSLWIPLPLSSMMSYLSPPCIKVTEISVDPASKLFSMSSFTARKGRNMLKVRFFSKGRHNQSMLFFTWGRSLNNFSSCYFINKLLWQLFDFRAFIYNTSSSIRSSSFCYWLNLCFILISHLSSLFWLIVCVLCVFFWFWNWIELKSKYNLCYQAGEI